MKHLSFLLVIAPVSVCLGVSPAVWRHATEADFAPGHRKSTVVSSLGEIRLARQTQVLVTSEEAPAVVSAIVVWGETIYAAAGSKCEVFKITGGKIAKFADLPGALVGCLLWDGKQLIAGTCGKGAGVYRIDSKGKATAVWKNKEVRHVWAIAPGPQKRLYVATGPEGKVFAVEPSGKAEVIYEAGKLAKNILCLAGSGDGLLYAGTDEEGLVVEIDPEAKTGRVILDAAEKEISAVLPVKGGGVFAATSDADEGAGDGAAPPSTAESGRAGPASRPTTHPKPQDAADESGASAADERPSRGPLVESSEALVMALGAAGAMTAPAEDAAESAAPEDAGGNAVYFIGADGLVRTVFRRPVTILAMVKTGQELILGTGNGGAIYSVSTDGQEIAQLADTEAKQVTALTAADDGRLVFGTANKGSVGILAKGVAKKGTFISSVLDAQQAAKWGTFRATLDVPEGSRATFSTRSGNVAKPDEKTWGAWSQEAPLASGFERIQSPPGRYLQYRLTLAAGADGSPAVRDVEIIYQVANLAPIVSGVAAVRAAMASEEAEASGAVGPMAFRHVTISASDANGDTLVFTVAFRQVGGEKWIKIADKLSAPTYVWDTRTVGDGTYELCVTASDSPSNPPGSELKASRFSDRIVVDNTPPAVKRLATAQEGSVKVEGLAEDASSRIVSIGCSVDSVDEWIAVLPKDGICDSPAEKFAFEVKDLEAGAHRIAVRVEDSYGNVGYSAVAVTVK